MEYRVLARKYRPTTFTDLIGQDVLVRTLSNAIASNRMAHAFLLTGIRGVGKTTTARIMARALNCIGSDGQGNSTINPCGVCTNCRMISDDRHIDVIEMDAASHTGVGDIRELIDTVRYLPSSARYKVYIIDEVHMLSASAFNALLKTLEEPPAHVKFIFATTEARKIPVTILSRCQRFDLKRIDEPKLSKHLADIAAKERIELAPEAARLIAFAAEGSVRDALSLLDQAIARGTKDDGTVLVEASEVRDMMGGQDHAAIFTLLETLLQGDIPAALDRLRGYYASGKDPLLMVQDLLETTHLVTRMKVTPDAVLDITLSEQDRTRAKTMAGRLSLPALARLWQMWLKGISEVRVAPSPIAALEMLMMRIAYAAQLPTPGEVIRGVEKSTVSPDLANKPNLELVSAKASLPVASFAEVVALFDRHREPLLYSRLKQDVQLVAFELGKIELHLTAALPRDFTTRVAECLTRWTEMPWKIVLSDVSGEPSLREQETARQEAVKQQTAQHPLVASMLEQFPGAKITAVNT